MKTKELLLGRALDHIRDGMSIMLGGFLDLNAPLACIAELAQRPIRDLTVISIASSAPGATDFGIGELFKQGRVKKFISSHIGSCPALLELHKNGAIEVEFFPLGTLIEKIRAGGAGLGGVLTPVGLGTLMEEGKQKVVVDGREFLLEKPLRADVAILRGHKADRLGNVQYKGTMNTNPTMALAADYVIAEVDEVVEPGEIDPERVGTPGILVDAVVRGYGEARTAEIFRNLWVKTKKLA